MSATKTKAKESDRGVTGTALAVPDKLKTKATQLQERLLETKQRLLREKSAVGKQSHDMQNKFIAENGPCDRVTHAEVEQFQRLMTRLAAIKRRSSRGYGDAGGGALGKCLNKMGEALGYLTQAAAENMAATLFPDRYESRRDEFSEIIRSIDEELSQIRRALKSGDAEELDERIQSAECSIKSGEFEVAEDWD